MFKDRGRWNFRFTFFSKYTDFYTLTTGKVRNPHAEVGLPGI